MIGAARSRTRAHCGVNGGNGGEHRLAELPRPDGPVTLLAGPEGGLTTEEAMLAHSRGFQAARLGPRVLRTETAALAALAAIQTLWGDF